MMTRHHCVQLTALHNSSTGIEVLQGCTYVEDQHEGPASQDAGTSFSQYEKHQGLDCCRARHGFRDCQSGVKYEPHKAFSRSQMAMSGS